VSILSGSTILIFQGSAQDRRLVGMGSLPILVYVCPVLRAHNVWTFTAFRSDRDLPKLNGFESPLRSSQPSGRHCPRPTH
ncbi:MAG: hypothetical protein P8125_13355, partial [Gemmatimonadota bacterium]